MVEHLHSSNLPSKLKTERRDQAVCIQRILNTGKE
jgi:hypothetical protein